MLITLLFVVETGFSQGFVNLNFETATISTNHNPGGDTYTALISGWIPSNVPFNSINLDAPGVNLEGTNSPFVPAIEGNYSIFLQGGSSFSPDTNGASIGQTGQIPANSLSLMFWGYISSTGVSFDGQTLSLVTLGSTANYNIYGADISAFAGQTGQLLFTVPWQSAGVLDNIQFSSTGVPEPSTLALTAFGAFLLGFCRWRNSSH